MEAFAVKAFPMRELVVDVLSVELFMIDALLMEALHGQ